MGADNTFGDTNFNPKMEIDNELAKAQQKYKGKFVEYAGGKYEVYGVTNLFGCLFVQIYDEPPSKHVDMVKLSSVKLINDNVESSSEPLEEKPTSKIYVDGDFNKSYESRVRGNHPFFKSVDAFQAWLNDSEYSETLDGKDFIRGFNTAASKANARISSIESELKALREEREGLFKLTVLAYESLSVVRTEPTMSGAVLSSFDKKKFITKYNLFFDALETFITSVEGKKLLEQFKAYTLNTENDGRR